MAIGIKGDIGFQETKVVIIVDKSCYLKQKDSLLTKRSTVYERHVENVGIGVEGFSEGSINVRGKGIVLIIESCNVAVFVRG